jgi:hypothetical protein
MTMFLCYWFTQVAFDDLLLTTCLMSDSVGMAAAEPSGAAATATVARSVCNPEAHTFSLLGLSRTTLTCCLYNLVAVYLQ